MNTYGNVCKVKIKSQQPKRCFVVEIRGLEYLRAAGCGVEKYDIFREFDGFDGFGNSGIGREMEGM